MKALFFFILLVNACYSRAQYTNIPDPNFEAALHWAGIDPIQGDGQVLTSNIDTVTQILFYPFQISDLTGIEHFSALRILNLPYNSLASLDLSNNLELTHISIEGNEITNLKLGSLPNLTHLVCGANPLTSSGLDVSNCLSLQYLNCSGGGFSTLDISNHPSIETLWCFGGSVETLNMSNTPNLKDVLCGNNPLTDINFFNTPSLNRFSAHSSQLIELDFSSNSELYSINVHSNPLQCLNLKNGRTSFSQLFVHNTPDLYCIEVQDSIAATSWTDPGDYNFDSNVELRENCGYSCTNQTLLTDTPTKYVVRIVDLTGRETPSVANTTLIYIYSDGTKDMIYRFE